MCFHYLVAGFVETAPGQGGMLPSLLTALLFAASGICGRRSAVAFGALRANALRLSFAALLLGGWVLWHEPVDFSTRSAHRLLLSGAVGFGLGDACLFLAYPRIGARLTILLNLCSAPLFGAGLDWFLVGTGLSVVQGCASLVILVGVVLALWGGRQAEREVQWGGPGVSSGVVFALLAGLGQGCGAALSRHAHAAMVEEGRLLSGVTQAFVRTLPGIAFGLVLWFLVSQIKKAGPPLRTGRSSWGWLMGAVLCGPVVGVSCFQWALGLQSSVVVLSITATAPVLIMPMALLVDGDRPTVTAVGGAIMAVAGVILMLWLTHG